MSRETMGGEGAVLTDELEYARRAGPSARAAILVEGASDRRAIAALARRMGRDLEAEGVALVATAGATNIRRFLEVLGPGGHGVELAGLCDENEEAEFSRALEDAGLGADMDRKLMESLGFHVCVKDLEDELVRAIGTEAMVQLIEAQGQLRRLRSFQNQPAQRHKTVEQQIWRWLGNHKIRYAPLMAEALDLNRIPRPLAGVLTSV